MKIICQKNPEEIKKRYRMKIFGKAKSMTNIWKDYNVIFGTMSQQAQASPQSQSIMKKLREVEDMVRLPPTTGIKQLEMYFLRRNLTKEAMFPLLTDQNKIKNPEDIKSDKQLIHDFQKLKASTSKNILIAELPYESYCSVQKEQISNIMKGGIAMEKQHERNQQFYKKLVGKGFKILQLPQVIIKKYKKRNKNTMISTSNTKITEKR